MPEGDPLIYAIDTEWEQVNVEGLMLKWFFVKRKNATGEDEILPRGAVLSKNGARVLAVKLFQNNTEVARAEVNRPSPAIAKAFPGNRYAANSGFLISHDVAKKLGTYVLVASIEGEPDVTIARAGTRPGKGPFDYHHQKQLNPDILEEDFWDIAHKSWPNTMLDVTMLYNAYSSSKYLLESNIPGDIIECGVALGGVVMMMEEMCLRYDKTGSRRVFAMDTFDGFPSIDETKDIDIRSGLAMSNIHWEDFFHLSSANMRSVKFPRLNIVRGDVMKTIPTVDVDKIALLRLDTDTYDTTRFELEQLYDRVSIGGVVIIDDYGFTYGCRQAVEEFIAGRGIFPQRLNSWSRAWVKALP